MILICSERVPSCLNKVQRWGILQEVHGGLRLVQVPGADLLIRRSRSAGTEREAG